MTDSNTEAVTKLTDEQIDTIMEQAQVFASAWSLVGGVFDHGDALETAEQEKKYLRAQLAALIFDVAQAPSEDTYVAQRMSELMAEVYAIIIGDDARPEDEALNAIERVKKAAQVIRLEVDLYRAQRNADAEQAPVAWVPDYILQEIAQGRNISSTRLSRDQSTDCDAPLYGGPVAPTPETAPALNLEGLRERLLAPRAIVRDENGWLYHPEYPVCDEGMRADKFLEAFGIETRFVGAESDSPDFAERWHEEGLCNCSEWTPTTPEGDGWLLLEIYDTEDGPYAMFGRDLYEAENARKRAYTRRMHDEVMARRAALAATAQSDAEKA